MITKFNYFLNENIKIDFKVGDVLSYSKMVDYIINNNLHDASGEIDYDDAKYMAGAADKWVLKMINLDNFDWYADSKYKNKSANSYPIILDLGDGEYDVLDGKHRIGMYKDMGIKEYPMWVGEI